jgi:hypothetical protein
MDVGPFLHPTEDVSRPHFDGRALNLSRPAAVLVRADAADYIDIAITGSVEDLKVSDGHSTGQLR